MDPTKTEKEEEVTSGLILDGKPLPEAKFTRNADESDEAFRARIMATAEPIAPLVDHRTPEEKAKDATDATAWLTDPQNKQKAILLAQQVQVVMGKTWFNLRAFTKRIGESRQAAFTKLSVLGQFGLMAKRGEGEATKFRVILSTEERLAVLRLLEVEHEYQLRALRHEIAKLRAGDDVVKRSFEPGLQKIQESGKVLILPSEEGPQPNPPE